MATNNSSRPGEQNGRAKLTAEQVREILRDPRGYRSTARTYGVHRSHIARIRKGRSWASVAR